MKFVCNVWIQNFCQSKILRVFDENLQTNAGNQAWHANEKITVETQKAKEQKILAEKYEHVDASTKICWYIN